MSETQHNQTGALPPLPEDLVAYLDGELEPEAAQRIEQKLSADDALRDRLHQYQQAWDLLDELPKTRVNDRFRETTIEMVAVSASQAEARLGSATRRRWLLIGGGLSIAASLLAGYWSAATLLSRPERQLVKDLPVIEDLDAYRYAESVEFLRSLAENGLFVVEEAEDAL